MLELCPRCGKLHYQTDACATKSTAARKDVQRGATRLVSGTVKAGPAGTQAPSVDIKILSGIITEAERKLKSEMINPKRGRPRIHPDRKAYKAQKERERRAKAKT